MGKSRRRIRIQILQQLFTGFLYSTENFCGANVLVPFTSKHLHLVQYILYCTILYTVQ
jgi:hypothetical protein